MSRTRMLSTVFVNGGDKMTATLGVLLDRDRIAFPESYWIKDTGMTVDVLCSDRKVKALINLEDRIPEKKRLYLAKGIVEVKVSSIAIEQCFKLRRLGTYPENPSTRQSTSSSLNSNSNEITSG